MKLNKRNIANILTWSVAGWTATLERREIQVWAFLKNVFHELEFEPKTSYYQESQCSTRLICNLTIHIGKYVYSSSSANKNKNK